MLYALTIAIGPEDSLTFFTAMSAAITAASMPGDWLALTTAEVGVSRSIVGLAASAEGAISAGLYIFTSPWLLPHSSAAVMISAWTAASSSSQPTIFSACAVLLWASAIVTVTVLIRRRPAGRVAQRRSMAEIGILATYYRRTL